MRRLTRPLLRIASVWTACLLAGCNIDIGGGSTGPQPQPLLLLPAGTQERGATFAVETTNRSIAQPPYYNPVSLGPENVEFQPADAVTWDAATLRFTWVKLGPVTITEKLPSPQQNAVNVIEAPTFYFDMSVGGNRDIYRATMFGLNVERITTSAGDDVHPTISYPWLVFTSYRDGNAELYGRSLDPPGPDIRLSNTAANETEPELSPNGRYLTYVRDDGGVPRIWIADGMNTNPALLTGADPGTIERSPRWYSTSDYILFAARTTANYALYRTTVTPGTKASLYLSPVTTDTSFIEPEPFGLRTTNVAAGSFVFTASGPAAGKSLIQSSSVTFTGGAGPDHARIHSNTISASQPRWARDAGRLLLTITEADGSTTIGWLSGVTNAGALPFRIPLSGSSPQRPSSSHITP